MKNKRRLMTATAILALATMATPGFAWMNDWSGSWMNGSAGTAIDRQSLSVEQQKKVDEIQSKYQPQLQELRDKLNAKQDELFAARSDDATTVGRLNELEGELYRLERDYWTKLDQANLEVNRVAGGGYGSWFTCEYRGCDGDMRRQGMMNYRGGSSYRYGSCCM